MSDQNENTYAVEFAAGEHPDIEHEIVTVESGIIDRADAKERAVVAAAEQSPYTHVETAAISKQESS